MIVLAASFALAYGLFRLLSAKVEPFGKAMALRRKGRVQPAIYAFEFAASASAAAATVLILIALRMDGLIVSGVACGLLAGWLEPGWVYGAERGEAEGANPGA